MTDPTRLAAFDLLSAVLDKRRTLDEALAALPAIDPRDKAAAHRLAAAVLRRAGTLDAALEPFLRKAPPDPVRHILRIGAAALLLLDTPPHAAVATAVDLARARGLAPFTGLINAVLRKLTPAALDGLDSPRLDTPPWLWASWGREARAIATAHQLEAPLDLTLKPGAEAPPGGEPLPTGSWRYPPGTRVADLPGFAEGNFWVQDAAAALPALLLAPQPGERIADLCAAPGGKTAQLSAAGAEVFAVEQSPARLVRLRENLARLNLSATIIQGDATTWQPEALLDAVLLDAPCTATGTIRRHPEVAHLRRPRDVVAMAEQQSRLLAAATAMLKPGGRLVYAVCSLQPEEGPAQFAAALATLPLTSDPEGWLRTTPAQGMDGFFIAKAIRQ